MYTKYKINKYNLINGYIEFDENSIKIMTNIKIKSNLGLSNL